MSGTVRLKNAVAAKLLRDNDLTYQEDEIIVSNGAKQIIFNAMMATLEAGDEVLLCAPYFGSYKDIVLSLGGTPVAISCRAENGFRLTAAELESAITPRDALAVPEHAFQPGGRGVYAAAFTANRCRSCTSPTFAGVIR